MARKNKPVKPENKAKGCNLPKKYLSKNADLPPRLFDLLKDSSQILYFMILDGLLTVYTVGGQSSSFTMSLKDLIPFLKPSKFLQVERAFVVNKSYISDQKKFDCGWMLYLGREIKIPMWTKLEKTVKKLISQNAAKQWLNEFRRGRQPKTRRS